MRLALVVIVAFALPAAAQEEWTGEAATLLSDVCLAVACDEAALQASPRSVAERLARLRVSSRESLDAIYEALDAPRDPGRGIAADALETVEALLEDESQDQGGSRGWVLGIPQKEMPDPHPYLLERSTLYPFQQGLILEAQVAPHLYVYESLTKPDGVYLHGGNALAISITPMFKVRIRNQDSAPVQTLSFMPKLNLQYFRLPRKKDDVPWSGEGSAFWMKGGLFSWGHHSNGQTECLYQPGVPDAGCERPASPAEVTVNYPNGSFSTNYLKLGVFFTRMRLGRMRNVGGGRYQEVVQSKTTLAATLEINPPGLPPGGSMDEPARSLYGANRMGVIVEHEQRLERGPVLNGSWRATGSVEYIDKVEGAGSSRWRFMAEAAWEPDWFRSGGFVARYVHGQDYYNLRFGRDIHWLQVGIVFSASEFEPFATQR